MAYSPPLKYRGIIRTIVARYNPYHFAQVKWGVIRRAGVGAGEPCMDGRGAGGEHWGDRGERGRAVAHRAVHDAGGLHGRGRTGPGGGHSQA